MDNYQQLDEQLKLLNGFGDDSSKRKSVLDYICDNGKIAVFAYGSLLWNPINYVNEIVHNCRLNGYIKGFICYDCVYRGTRDFHGLTMGLRNDDDHFVNGALLISSGDEIIPFIDALIKRDAPAISDGNEMDIYRFDFLDIMMPGGIECQKAFTCVANENSRYYAGNKLTVDQQAEIIAQASGRNGTNLEYLKTLCSKFLELKITDSSTSDFYQLYEKILYRRQGSWMKEQKQLLTMFDGLATTEERNQAQAVREQNTEQSSL